MRGCLVVVLSLSCLLVAGCGTPGLRARLGCAFRADRICRHGVVIREELLDDNAYNRRYKLPGPMPEVRYVTIHNTANNASAQDERDYLNRRRDRKYISFHYAVDETEAIRIIPHDQHAWHAGDGRNGKGNRQSIGVEICRSTCTGDRDTLYRRSEANAVRLTAWLLEELNLSVNDLRMHQDWSGKFCPHRILGEKRWEQFKAAVAVEMGR
jgi:N-acetylmuramoyl-L-alanine amidase CwlA